MRVLRALRRTSRLSDVRDAALDSFEFRFPITVTSARLGLSGGDLPVMIRPAECAAVEPRLENSSSTVSA